MKTPLHFVLLGAPASGKGTQGRRLAGEYKLDYLSTGGLLRSEMKKGSELGAQAKLRLDKGQYVPDSLITPMVQGWCEEKHEGWVLDGFPRTVPQASCLDRELTAAITLDVPYEELERRVAGRVECASCHYVASRETLDVGEACPQCSGEMRLRHDDDLENFRSRYRQYEIHTLPLVEYYRERGRLVSVDGTGAPDEVFARMIDALELANESALPRS